MIDFKVEWTETEVARVLQRVRDCRLPPALPGMGWNLGCDADFLHKIQQYWVDGYDWRDAVATLNRYPQFKAEVDGLEIHFVHVVGEAQGRRPLLLTHGWPGSHFEFWGVIDALAYPSRHGGSAEDAFDLIIPSLPGFGFSGKPQKLISQRTTAALWNKLMTEVLGYQRYRAQGGDWGALVTSWLGLDYGATVQAIHLNMLGFRSMDPPQDALEQAWARQSDAARGKLGGYSALQITKPQSLAWAVADNPLGQAAWILERFHDWSDLRRRSFEEVFSMDHLLTNIMIYVMTGSFATAACYYPGVAMDGFALLPHGQRCETPTAYADFSGDASQPSPPRSRVALTYRLTHWSTAPEGGHFAAMEAPDWFAGDIRAWGRS